MQNRKNAANWILLSIIFGAIFYTIYAQQKQSQTIIPYQPTIAPPLANANNLKLGSSAIVQTIIDIPLNECIELDFKSKEDVLRIRAKYVNQHPDLVEGKYTPSTYIFNDIVDNKPWWGLQGLLCYGQAGENSVKGLSEETRFLANPFLLLGIDECFACMSNNPSCYPVYPKPISLSWDASNSQAEATYDMSNFLSEKRKLGFFSGNIMFYLHNYNARDFGYQYVYAVPQLSKGINAGINGQLFKNLSLLKGYIHLGNSCGYPGGCNNSSPRQPELEFRVSKIPATLYCKLYKTIPADLEQEADFVFIIKFQ